MIVLGKAMFEADDTISPTDLLTRSFFHDRIIPPLNSRKLEGACGDLLDFAAADVTTAKKNRWQLPQRSRCSEHSVPKRKHLRRRLAIPNPRHQAILCLGGSANWPDLRKICELSPIFLNGSASVLDPRNRGQPRPARDCWRKGNALNRGKISASNGLCQVLPLHLHTQCPVGDPWEERGAR
jgi:hypothetical protein